MDNMHLRKRNDLLDEQIKKVSRLGSIPRGNDYLDKLMYLKEIPEAQFMLRSSKVTSAGEEINLSNITDENYGKFNVQIGAQHGKAIDAMFREFTLDFSSSVKYTRIHIERFLQDTLGEEGWGIRGKTGAQADLNNFFERNTHMHREQLIEMLKSWKAQIPETATYNQEPTTIITGSTDDSGGGSKYEDQELFKEAEKRMYHQLERGWDTVHGGIYYFLDSVKTTLTLHYIA
jgi:hypothetical protein